MRIQTAHISISLLVTGLFLFFAAPSHAQDPGAQAGERWTQALSDLTDGLSVLEMGALDVARFNLRSATRKGHLLAALGPDVAIATRVVLAELARLGNAPREESHYRREVLQIAFGVGEIDERLVALAPAFFQNAPAEGVGRGSPPNVGMLALYLRERVSTASRHAADNAKATLGDRPGLYRIVTVLQGMAASRAPEGQIELLATTLSLSEESLGLGEQYTLELATRYFQSINASRALTDHEFKRLSQIGRFARDRFGPHSEMTQALRFLQLQHLEKIGSRNVLLEMELALQQLSSDLGLFSRPYGARDPEGSLRAGVVAKSAFNLRRLAIEASELPEADYAEHGYRRHQLIEIAYRAAQLELVGPLTLASRAAKLRREARKAGMAYTHNWDSHMSRSSELWLELDEVDGAPSDVIQKTIKDLKFHRLFANHGEAKFEAGVPHFRPLLKPETIGPSDDGDAGRGIDSETALILIASGAGDDDAEVSIFVQTDEGVIHTRADWAASEFSTAIARFRNSILGVSDRPDLIAMRAPLGQVPQSETTPVDLELGHQIYRALFGDPSISDLVGRRENWVIAARGAFLSLPFAALPTGPSMAGQQDADLLRRTPWLGLERNLHFVGSLADAASVDRMKDAGEDADRAGYIGFGDPLFSGQSRPIGAPDLERLNRGNERLAAVASLPRLPATRKEVVETGSEFPKASRMVRLGALASEAELYAMSATGALRNLSVLHFATHGILDSGDVGDIGAALAMTPPERAYQIAPGITGDGLLTLSEIGLLQMDVDLVVLSACNTASGERSGGEALTGLARVFLEAGAESVLATHWAIEDAAAQKIVSATLRDVANDAEVADALRASIADVIADRSRDHSAVPYSHPLVWAPFIAFSSP